MESEYYEKRDRVTAKYKIIKEEIKTLNASEYFF